MEVIEAIILGIVQGFTEFLPVSSSGHLVMAQKLLGTQTTAGILFEVSVHIATLVAILIFYRKRITQLTIGAVSADKDAWRYILKLGIATIPAVIIALFARDWIEQQFESLLTVSICLIITGFIVWSTRYTLLRGNATEPGWISAIIIGCVQAFAILPGISRSGSTLAIALALGLAPLAGAEFSFLLGVIAIAGAGILLLPEITTISGNELNNILFGGIAALISGLIALWMFVWLLKNQCFYLFSWYLWIVGLIALASTF